MRFGEAPGLTPGRAASSEQAGIWTVQRAVRAWALTLPRGRGQAFTRVHGCSLVGICGFGEV